MASTINASNSGFGGIVSTGDSSGVLQLQAGGTTVATIQSTGVAVTGALTQTVGGSNTNTAIGTSALNANTSGTSLTAIGDRALYSNTANNNNALGSLAGYSNTTGTENSFFGRAAGFANTTGGYNTAVGNLALNANTIGTNNTTIGYTAGYVLTGSQQTIVGYDGATNLTTGNNGIYIGYSTRAGAVGANFEIVIGGATTGKGSQTTYINAGGGASYNGANVTTWATTSDQRIKKNITPLESSLNKIVALNPVEFDYKENDKHEIGFIAQEFETVFPDQIITHDPNEAEKEWVGEDKVKAIQQNLVPYLVKAIQEQQTIINDLKARIETLESK